MDPLCYLAPQSITLRVRYGKKEALRPAYLSDIIIRRNHISYYWSCFDMGAFALPHFYTSFSRFFDIFAAPE